MEHDHGPQRTAGRVVSGDAFPAGGAVRLAARELLAEPTLRTRARLPLPAAGRLLEVAVLADLFTLEAGGEGRDPAWALECAVVCVAARCGLGRASALRDAPSGVRSESDVWLATLALADEVAQITRAIRECLDRSSRFHRRVRRPGRRGCRKVPRLPVRPRLAVQQHARCLRRRGAVQGWAS